MKLIANKPCSFGGLQFYIGDEVPVKLVTDVKTQEKLGVLSVVPDVEKGENKGEAQYGAGASCLYTQEQVEHKIAEAVADAVNNTIMEMEQRREAVEEGKLLEEEIEAHGGAVLIEVMRESDDGDSQVMEILAVQSEIRQVFSILQMNAEEGARMIAEVESENVLILLHVADSRKTIKDAARKQADKLFQKKTVDASGGESDPQE